MDITGIEYSLTHQVELPDRTSMWVKYGASASLSGFEDAEAASRHLSQHVHRAMEERISEAVSHTEKLGS